ncbi:hypothetical protein CONPUDRAFT_147751 [Coniophora puteana RWD-64-598 SS2]|uniref:Nucleotidyltransferase n=1 Tax=Coniophora puteana (strain RWD-64-598) TaxID=741705 RepID=R7SE07_CONPW|nr:uncharacterized protein CONPUDRAFT_147751 [Coniophora puteana RWD-64-598 SS2]EIW74406.1 hypothetical protein CONPUDRAFT_147751 [Coniophora puteana RWD-64-598 SS2]
MFPPTGPPTLQEIRQVARKTASALGEAGYRCCLFGSVACSMYGMRNRTPNDVDMVVFTSHDPEGLKQTLVDADDRYFTLPAQTPDETYEVLWFSLRSSGRRQRQCKVDILVTGTLGLPSVPRSKVEHTNVPGIPCVPMIVLLGMKLRGWEDHCEAYEPRYFNKQYDDVEDIVETLQIAVDRGDHLEDALWLPRRFREEMEDRVRSFVWDVRMDTAELWRELGFDGDW